MWTAGLHRRNLFSVTFVFVAKTKFRYRLPDEQENMMATTKKSLEISEASFRLRPYMVACVSFGERVSGSFRSWAIQFSCSSGADTGTSFAQKQM